MHAIRPAQSIDLDPLARLWHAGWREAHLRHVPEALARKRTLTSFRKRLDGFGDKLRVAGSPGRPIGFCTTGAGEVDQLFVAPAARGTGLARRLLADGEARLAAGGTTRAFLLCVIENTRAARFYAREGWTDMGVSTETLQTEDGPFRLDVLRFEKRLDARV